MIVLLRELSIAAAFLALGCEAAQDIDVDKTVPAVSSAEPNSSSPTATPIVAKIQSYAQGLSAVRTTNADVRLSLETDPALPGERVLSIEYPAPSQNPAGRDVWCDAENADWRSGSAIFFRAKAEHPMRLSVSFMDGHRVAYTSWIDLDGSAWQPVRVAFDAIRPNPYFQPPGADTHSPIDVSNVVRIGFAPQDPNAGRLVMSPFVVIE
jgi:hypothetical protein